MSEDLGKMLDELCAKMLVQVSADFVRDPDVPEDQTGARPVKLSERIEAFKAASAYYIAKTKVKQKQKPDDSEGFNFAASRAKIKSVEGQA